MKNNQLRQVVFPILAAFIWGTAFVAQDVCADAMGAFTFNGITSPCCPCWWFWPFQAASGRIGPSSPLRRRRPSAGSCGWAASAAARCWPLPPTSSKQVLWPVPTAARPGSSPPCMWCWCRCSACSSGGGSACRCGSPWPCPWALCTCCVSRAASPWPPATCWCWYVPYAFPYISW